MKQDAYVLDAGRREIVLNSLHEACSRRGWLLLAFHVRTNHVHAVVGAQCKPEPVMAAMKAYSSQNLNRLRLESSETRRWARHGSTQYLWTGDAVHAAIRYVVHKQGEPMAVFEAPSLAVARGSEFSARGKRVF